MRVRGRRSWLLTLVLLPLALAAAFLFFEQVVPLGTLHGPGYLALFLPLVLILIGLSSRDWRRLESELTSRHQHRADQPIRTPFRDPSGSVAALPSVHRTQARARAPSTTPFLLLPSILAILLLGTGQVFLGDLPEGLHEVVMVAVLVGWLVALLVFVSRPRS